MWEFVFKVFTHHEYFVLGKMVVKRLTDVLHRSFRIRCNDVLNGYWSVESAEKFTGTFTGYRNYRLSLQEHVTGIWLPNPEIWLPNPWSVTLIKKIFNSSHHLIHNLSLISPFDIRSSGSSFYPNIYYNFYRSDDFPNNLSEIWLPNLKSTCSIISFHSVWGHGGSSTAACIASELLVVADLC